MRSTVTSLFDARSYDEAASICLTVPSEIIRIDITNMQVREEDPLGIIHMQFLKALYFKEAGTTKDLHELFGIGISLSRIVVKELLAKEIIQDSGEGPSSWWEKRTKKSQAVRFHTEEDKLPVPDPLDTQVFELSEEGRTVAESGRYTPIKIKDRWHGFFTLHPLRFIPAEVMDPLLRRLIGRELDDDLWKEKNDAEPYDSMALFSEQEDIDLRRMTGIPDTLKGPLFSDKENEETGYVTKKSTISWKMLETKLSVPVTFVMKGYLHKNPEIVNCYLPPKLVPPDPYRLQGDIQLLDDTISEHYWSIFRDLCKNNNFWASQLSTQESEKKGGIKYRGGIPVNGRIQHIFWAISETVKIDDEIKTRESSDNRIFPLLPDSEGLLELEFRLIPGTAGIAKEWLMKRIDQLSFPEKQFLDSQELQRIIGDEVTDMKEFWLEERYEHIQQVSAPSVDEFVERRWENGDWKLIYQLSFKEDFPYA